MLGEERSAKLPDGDLSIPVRGRGPDVLGRGHPMATQQISGFKQEKDSRTESWVPSSWADGPLSIS